MSGPEPVSHRRGRRSAEADDARHQILEVARQHFESRAYAGVSMRGIARAAGVDAALVSYYFGGKRQLFLACMAFPKTPGELIASLADVPVDELGEAMVRSSLKAWGDPAYLAAVRGVLQDMFTGDAPFPSMGRFAFAEIVEPIAARLTGPAALQRAALATSHVFGVIFTRHLAELEPLVDADADTLVRVVGGVAQRYLTGDLGDALAPGNSSSGVR